MKERDFEQKNAALWSQFEQWFDAVRKNGKVSHADFPVAYRQLCNHLSMARQRGYSEALVARLNRLVMAGHHQLYQREKRLGVHSFSAIIVGFMKALRRQRRFILASAVLFVLPALVMGIAAYLDESFTFSLISPEQAADIEAMYDPGNLRIGPERDAETDLAMFGFYINHNIGIAFRSFAGGIFFGVGAAVVVLYNGLYLGAVSGHLTQAGLSATFYPFVVGHGAFELTAIVISGAAGMTIGHALINPGRMRRIDALREAAKQAVQLMYGAVVMLLIAAFLEAFWSSSMHLPIVLKLSVGAFFWAVVLWFCFCATLGGKRGPE